MISIGRERSPLILRLALTCAILAALCLFLKQTLNQANATVIIEQEPAPKGVEINFQDVFQDRDSNLNAGRALQ